MDGVAIINLIIAVLENMQGKVDGDLKDIINIVVQEIQWVSQKKGYAHYKSMLLQCMAMCFTYNSALAFEILEGYQQTLFVFQNWFVLMNSFKNDFELRRNIFGLSSILKQNPLPDLVAQKLPDMLN